MGINSTAEPVPEGLPFVYMPDGVLVGKKGKKKEGVESPVTPEIKAEINRIAYQLDPNYKKLRLPDADLIAIESYVRANYK